MRLIGLWMVFGLLCAGFVSASWSPYFTVVDELAPASEVVAAANFAASMRASTGASFSGRTASDISNLEAGNEEFLVVFSGKNVWFVQDPLSTIEHFSTVEANARAYLEEQGFTVLDAPKKSSAPAPAVVKKESPPEESPVVVEEPEPVVVPSPIAEDPVEEVREDQDVALPDSVEEEPGFFSRVWHWFVTIFS